MKKLFLIPGIIVLCLLLTACNGQKTPLTSKEGDNKIVGGGCDGCELMYVGIPKNINSIDISAGWNEVGQKLIITGTVFRLDGKTPASDVIIYYWQADNSGRYSPVPGMDERAKRHGHIRGWVKTGPDGEYTIKTIRPAHYPNEETPAHIHLAIKEPGIANEYYTDEINFDDDRLLIPHFKKYPQENRGGSGVVRVLTKDNFQFAEHNIILGLNIPNYPKEPDASSFSGLNIGEDQPSFSPFHAFGPDRGKQVCPVCKYGRYHGILYFVGNNPDWNQIKNWLQFLELESIRRQKYLKVYLVYGNEKSYNKLMRQKQLEQIGEELAIQKTALTFVPSFSDRSTEANLNKINSEVANTFIIYKHRNIVGKYINLSATEENFRMISITLDRTRGAYFDLKEMEYE